MHILKTNDNFMNIKCIDFVWGKKWMKIYSICVNMDYLYV